MRLDSVVFIRKWVRCGCFVSALWVHIHKAIWHLSGWPFRGGSRKHTDRKWGGDLNPQWLTVSRGGRCAKVPKDGGSLRFALVAPLASPLLNKATSVGVGCRRKSGKARR